MSKETVLQAFAGWFESASGLAANKVIIADGTPSGDLIRRAKPCAVINMTGDSIALGQDEPKVVDGVTADGVTTSRESIISRRISEVEVDVFGSGAADYIEAARVGMFRSDKIQIANASSIAVVEAGRTIDLSALVDTDIEERARALFSVAHTTETTFDPGGTIDSTDSTGTFELSGGSSITDDVDYPTT